MKPHLTCFSGTLCANDISPYGVPFCRSSGATLSSHFLYEDEAKGVSNIDFQYLYSPHYSPSFPPSISPSPSPAGQLLDLSFKGGINPECTQQPPSYVIDYWFHRLGLSVQATSSETLSNSTTVPPLFQTFDDTSSRVSPKSIILDWVFEMYDECCEGWSSDWLPLVPSRKLTCNIHSPRTPFDF